MNSKTSPQIHGKDFCSLFLEISRNMIDLPNEKAFFETILPKIGMALQANRVIIARRTTTLWHCEYLWLKDEHLFDKYGNIQEIDLNLLFETKYDNESFLQGHALIIEDASQEKNLQRKKHLEQYDINSLISMPLFDEGTCIGFLGVDQSQKINRWASEHLEIVETLGYLIQGIMAHFKVRAIGQKEEEEAQKILDAFPIPLYIVNPSNYEFILFNKAGKEFVKLADYKSTKCYEILYDFDSPCPFCSIGEHKVGGVPKVWTQHNEKFHTDFTLIESCIPWGNIQEAHTVVFIDISDSLALQKKQVLERETVKAKARFLANMSHELRTPVNGIEGMSLMAEKKNTNPIVASYLEKIKFSSRILLNVINNILDFSKIEAGKMELEHVFFQLRDSFKTLEQHFVQEAEAKHLQASFSIAENVPQMLLGDPLRLLQVVQNIAYNAIKFTEKGHVSIEISWKPQENTHAGILNITVSDTGIGISEKQMAPLFDLFYLGDASFTRRHGGTGIGLPVAQGFVKLMQGQINVESVVDKGSTFTCTIPFSVPQKMDSCLDATLTEIDCPDLVGTRVLLAEDNDINVIIALEALEDFGCDVDVATNGLEVLELTAHNDYDIVLMDVEMPQLNGLEATKKLRENPRFNHLPIIAMSAHSVQEMKELGMGEGMQDYISKPFAPQRLRHLISLYTKKEQNTTA